jgi:biopolymer transport protein TolQ
MNGITVTTNTQAALSPIALFLHADIVVKIVMLGLLFASLWTWTIIFGRGGVLRRADKQNAEFEKDFAKASDIDRFHEANARSEVPAARVFVAGMLEWRKSTSKAKVDKAATRERLASVMATAGAAEVEQLSRGLKLRRDHAC